MRDYSEYTARVRRYAESSPLSEAVEQAITECIKEGILAEFLSKNRAEAKKVSSYEYDEEKVMRMLQEDARETGRQEGETQKLKEQISKKLAKGNTPEEISEMLEEPVEHIRELIAELSQKASI